MTDDFTSANTINSMNAIYASLKKHYYDNLVRNMLFYDELDRVLRGFKNIGIKEDEDEISKRLQALGYI